MITITEDQVAHVQYLLDQALQGNHVLFRPDELKGAFSRPRPEKTTEGACAEDGYGVEHHIEKLMTLETLAQKRAYVERLDPTTFDRVVRTYFNIVENTLLDARKAAH